MTKLVLKTFVITTLLSAMVTCSYGQISTFTEDFEGLDMGSETALSDEDWLVFGNIFDPNGGFLFGYGPFVAPNSAAENVPDAFSAVAAGEGGEAQGAQQLSVFSDYQNENHTNGSNNVIESNVFLEFTADSSDLDKTYSFGFEFKTSFDFDETSTAVAFIKTLDPNNGFELTNFLTFATDDSPEWSGGSLELTIDEGLIGQLFQVGFLCTASNSLPSAVFYDNISLSEAADCLVGDTNGDGSVDLLDVDSFVAAVSTQTFSCEADANQDGSVDLLDVNAFVNILSGG